MTPLMVPGASEDLAFYSARSQAESATELSVPKEFEEFSELTSQQSFFEKQNTRGHLAHQDSLNMSVTSIQLDQSYKAVKQDDLEHIKLKTNVFKLRAENEKLLDKIEQQTQIHFEEKQRLEQELYRYQKDVDKNVYGAQSIDIGFMFANPIVTRQDKHKLIPSKGITY